MKKQISVLKMYGCEKFNHEKMSEGRETGPYYKVTTRAPHLQFRQRCAVKG